MSNKAILKMAGYKIMCNPKKPSPNWWWARHDENDRYIEESWYYHKTEEHSWTNAWKHYKQSIKGDKNV